ncbi:hypothetical protein B0T17DRAFT_524074 [Bombardia bombarda]|uniref:Uncharacterized protein n=1 Tax=Bombardia bombarda TaxID=252184 RepID=A0AA39X8K3_9PEZI|nr:hypothetical protein B0T17DRAFT_524074 [Bombardia bombarda]
MASFSISARPPFFRPLALTNPRAWEVHEIVCLCISIVCVCAWKEKARLLLHSPLQSVGPVASRPRGPVLAPLLAL